MGVYSPKELFGQRELLEKHKIEMPTATQIAVKLNNGGLSVDPSIIDEDELVEQIIKNYYGGEE